MADGHDLDLAREGLERARASRQERERQLAAQQALTTPSPPPEEASRIVRDADRLRLPPWAIETQPDIVQTAEAADQAAALRANPRLSEWISDPANAAVARDDIENLSALEGVMQWGRDALRDARDYGERAQEQNRRRQEGAARRAAEIDRRIGTREGREQSREELARAARQMGEQLSDPQWWKRQGEAAERNARNFVEGVGPFFEGVAEDVRVQPETSNRIYEQSQLGWRAMQGQATPVEMRRLAELEAMDSATPRTPIGYALQSSRMMWESIVSGLERGQQAGAMGAGVGAATFLALGQAGPQAALPEEFATVPAAAITGYGIGMTWGVPYGAFEETARIEGGLAFSEFRQMRDENGNPLDEGVARMAALAVAGVNGGLELFSLRAIMRTAGIDDIVGGVTRERMRELLMRPNVRRALQRASGNWLRTGVTESITEGMQEATLIVAGEWAKDQDGGVFYRPSFEENLARVGSSAWGGLQAGLVLGGVAATPPLVIDMQRARRANEDARFIESLGATAEASRLRQRLPARFRSVAEAIVRDGPLSSVYVDARAFEQYYQSMGQDPEKIADGLEGVGREAYLQALEAGDDVTIPLETFTARIAGTPQRQGLANHIRLRPDSDTIAEAMAYGANQEYLEGQIDELRNAQRLTDDELEAQQAMALDVSRRLDVAGVTVPEHNRMVGEFVSLAVANISKRAGKNPIEIHRRFMTRILGPFGDGEVAPALGAEVNMQPQVDPAAFAAETMRKHGLADLRMTLDEATGDLSLDIIGLAKKVQKRGAGTAAMNDVIEYADANGLRLVTTPPKRGGLYGTTSQARARAFLQRFGFVENSGDAKDPTIKAEMYRQARGVTRQDQAEQPITSTRRFDTRAVSAERARAGGVSIPDFGTPEFAALIEVALAKSQSGRPLSFLEQYALSRARSGAGAVAAGESYLQGAEPTRAGPLPPAGAQAVNRGSTPLPGAARATVTLGQNKRSAASESNLRALIAERDRLVREIEQRQESERDLPEMVEARKDAEAMRGLAYCTARGMVRSAATVAAIGSAVTVGSTLAAAGVAGAPTEVADGTLPPGAVVTPPADRRAVRTPSAVVAIPPPIQLPASNPEEAMAALPSEQAAEAEAPPSLTEAETAPAPDEPIVTNNHAQRPRP